MCIGGACGTGLQVFTQASEVCAQTDTPSSAGNTLVLYLGSIRSMGRER